LRDVLELFSQIQQAHLVLDDAVIYKIHGGVTPSVFSDCLVTTIEPGNPALCKRGVRSGLNYCTSFPRPFPLSPPSSEDRPSASTTSRDGI
jgi:hypothetical protein